MTPATKYRAQYIIIMLLLLWTVYAYFISAIKDLKISKINIVIYFSITQLTRSKSCVLIGCTTRGLRFFNWSRLIWGMIAIWIFICMHFNWPDYSCPWVKYQTNLLPKRGEWSEFKCRQKNTKTVAIYIIIKVPQTGLVWLIWMKTKEY